MAELKATPGPWHVDLDGLLAGSDEREIVALNADGRVVRGIAFVLLDTGDFPDGDEWQEDAANARLIAAAPDLYAALSELLAAYTDGVSECTCLLDADGSVMEHPANPCVECKSRAALAKARGEEAPK
jgi:hypothetical protein